MAGVLPLRPSSSRHGINVGGGQAGPVTSPLMGMSATACEPPCDADSATSAETERQGLVHHRHRRPRRRRQTTTRPRQLRPRLLCLSSWPLLLVGPSSGPRDAPGADGGPTREPVTAAGGRELVLAARAAGLLATDDVGAYRMAGNLPNSPERRRDPTRRAGRWPRQGVSPQAAPVPVRTRRVGKPILPVSGS